MTENRDAFWTAYYALEQHGVTHAQVRQHVADAIVEHLRRELLHHGTGRMLAICQDGGEQPVVDQVMAAKPNLFSVGRNATAEAVKAAARVLARS